MLEPKIKVKTIMVKICMGGVDGHPNQACSSWLGDKNKSRRDLIEAKELEGGCTGN
jgi:hypothetical protein